VNAVRSPLPARLLEDYASTARVLPSAGAAAARRQAALETLRTLGLPSSREEDWRYANLRVLERLKFVPASFASPAPAPPALPAPLPGFARYVFVDGLFAPASSAAADATAASITPLAQADDAAPFGAGPARTPAADERFALLNQAFAPDGAQVRVEAGGAPVRLEVLFVASADSAAGASYPRLHLHLAPGARLELIEKHVSATPVASFVTSAVAVELDRSAQLTHYRLQELSARSILFDTVAASLAQDASYRLHAISTGAQSARSTLGVQLAGERAEVALAVAALGDAQQVQDGYAVVEHAAPNARTVQTFRGIAAGRARVAFNGKVVVARQARGTDSTQSLRGLLAGPEAEIDVRPQLEIYNDEVRCSHGATAGKLDDNMLFYLLSRGLDRDSALRLLKWAFLEDVIAQVPLAPLRRQIEERLAGHLQDETLRELL
jgi:Fe-S cluster assembly protein SufD